VELDTCGLGVGLQRRGEALVPLGARQLESEHLGVQSTRFLEEHRAEERSCERGKHAAEDYHLQPRATGGLAVSRT
jgi:hypothetical protein